MNRFMRLLRTGLSLVICTQLVVPPAASAQTLPTELHIVVIDGEGAMNNIGQRSAHDPVIRIEDENQKPIAGAAVVFTLPTEGASGEFGDGSKTLIIMTDSRGEAAARGLKVNQVPGKLQIHVNASYRGLTARTNITQFNSSVPGKRAGGSGKTVLIVLAIAGAAAGGGIAATRKGNGSSAPPASPPASPISIAPGTGTVGPPR